MTTGRLRQEQVEGFDLLINEGLRRGVPINQIAYVLATAWHETAKTMQPIAEYGRGRGRKYGAPDPITGKTYYGRGYVQLTWKDNYRTMGEYLGVDLTNNPDLAMRSDLAAKIIYEGMLRGSFGKKLGRYVDEQECDFVNARRSVNVMDCADLIASYAKRFKVALIQAEPLAVPDNYA